jgi:hypothetical protein
MPSGSFRGRARPEDLTAAAWRRDDEVSAEFVRHNLIPMLFQASRRKPGSILPPLHAIFMVQADEPFGRRKRLCPAPSLCLPGACRDLRRSQSPPISLVDRQVGCDHKIRAERRRVDPGFPPGQRERLPGGVCAATACTRRGSISPDRALVYAVILATEETPRSARMRPLRTALRNTS